VRAAAGGRRRESKLVIRNRDSHSGVRLRAGAWRRAARSGAAGCTAQGARWTLDGGRGPDRARRVDGFAYESTAGTVSWTVARRLLEVQLLPGVGTCAGVIGLITNDVAPPSAHPPPAHTTQSRLTPPDVRRRPDPRSTHGARSYTQPTLSHVRRLKSHNGGRNEMTSRLISHFSLARRASLPAASPHGLHL